MNFNRNDDHKTYIYEYMCFDVRLQSRREKIFDMTKIIILCILVYINYLYVE